MSPDSSTVQSISDSILLPASGRAGLTALRSISRRDWLPSAQGLAVSSLLAIWRYCSVTAAARCGWRRPAGSALPRWPALQQAARQGQATPVQPLELGVDRISQRRIRWAGLRPGLLQIGQIRQTR
jgi:hypothetical protein